MQVTRKLTAFKLHIVSLFLFLFHFNFQPQLFLSASCHKFFIVKLFQLFSSLNSPIQPPFFIYSLHSVSSSFSFCCASLWPNRELVERFYFWFNGIHKFSKLTELKREEILWGEFAFKVSRCWKIAVVQTREFLREILMKYFNSIEFDQWAEVFCWIFS